jgi:hypothetical protein
MPWARDVARPSAALPSRASVADLRVHSLYHYNTASDLAVNFICVPDTLVDSQSAVVSWFMTRVVLPFTPKVHQHVITVISAVRQA